MAREDGRVRAELAATGELYDGYAPRMAAVHDAHAAELARVIDAHGWPGRRLVGDDGADAAWLVLQHAIGHPALLRRALPLLARAAALGDVPAAHVAHLDDRIRAFEGRPQRYGTQLDWDAHGVLSPLPLEDPARVDALRAEVGLGPLAAHVESVRATAGRPPADLAARERDARAWARRVGWRAD
ncbi:MAG: hypothetical protein H6745_15560 [Deltaproteobacteria bacterium]|nr:hypothetical protein [Deltaproteobacteria bacterium]